MNDPIKYPEEFARGKKHCEEGTPSEINSSRDYYRGYDQTYAHMEELTALSLHGGR